uniref:Uncharacterized protein n=1 Tax=Salvator merianae TaxID=96440 RepID=A0A8D0C476_SALMN
MNPIIPNLWPHWLPATNVSHESKSFWRLAGSFAPGFTPKSKYKHLEDHDVTLPGTETTTDTLQVTTFKTTSSPEMTTLGSTEPTETSVSHSPPLDTSTVPPLPTTLPPASYTGTGPDQDLQPSHIDQTEANLCEKDNKKQELVFLIIIGVLIFICLCLVLTVVVMASKLAYLKRRLPNKRLPRTNGDFLSASSLWPAGLDTLQRVTSETTGTGPRLQTSGAETLTAGQAKPSEEASKKLVSEISDRQKQKDTSATPQGNLITDIEI